MQTRRLKKSPPEQFCASNNIYQLLVGASIYLGIIVLVRNCLRYWNIENVGVTIFQTVPYRKIQKKSFFCELTMKNRYYLEKDNLTDLKP